MRSIGWDPEKEEAERGPVSLVFVMTITENPITCRVAMLSNHRPACGKLRLQSRLGLGSALVAAEEVRDAAAAVFGETVPLAAASGEDALRLDCYRLASFCHERADDVEAAYQWALDGLHAVQQMPRATLATSSFPYLGEASLRLCETTQREAERDELERAIASLAGGEPSAASPTASASAP